MITTFGFCLPLAPAAHPETDQQGNRSAHWRSKQAQERGGPRPHRGFASGNFIEVSEVADDQEGRSSHHRTDDERDRANQNGFSHYVIVPVLTSNRPQDFWQSG